MYFQKSGLDNVTDPYCNADNIRSVVSHLENPIDGLFMVRNQVVVELNILCSLNLVELYVISSLFYGSSGVVGTLCYLNIYLVLSVIYLPPDCTRIQTCYRLRWLDPQYCCF